MIGINRSTYYKRSREASENPLDLEIRDHIEKLHLEFPYYGYRRVQEDFRRQGVTINHKRIRRIMKENSLFPVVWRAFKVCTTDSNHKFRIYPNLLHDLEVSEINQVWVSDLTYIRIRDCFIYLAVVLDIYSRKVIGWAISKSLDRKICLLALQMAIEMRRPRAGLIHHSDRGVQYASEDYIEMLNENEIRISMSRKGNCWDNAFVESFFKTLKQEEVHLKNYETYEEVLENLPNFIEDVYNTKRFHSSLNYMSPVEFEANFLLKKSKKLANYPVLKLW
jgi:putative transposase